MKKWLFKSILIVMSVCMFLSAGMVSQNNNSCLSQDIFVVANAVSKKLRLKKSKVTLDVGKSYSQKLINKNGKNISASKIKWKSANKKVASVSKKGKVTAKKAGKTKITATYNNKKYTFTVVVEAEKSQTNSSENRGDPDLDDANGTVVFTTPTGKRYHLDPQCGGKNSKKTDLKSAQGIGLTPCKTCAS